jgi:hypothetical protein
MGSTKIKIIWKPEAIESLQNIYDYIWEFSPQNAENFVDSLIDFGDRITPNLKVSSCSFTGLKPILSPSHPDEGFYNHWMLD